jgi:hypothetical protein
MDDGLDLELWWALPRFKVVKGGGPEDGDVVRETGLVEADDCCELVANFVDERPIDDEPRRIKSPVLAPG